MAGRYSKLFCILVVFTGLLGAGLARSQECLDYGNYMHPLGGLDPQPHYSLNGCIEGVYLYLANGWSGLKVIDISDPAFPQVIGSVTPEGRCKSVALHENIAYLAATVGMHVVDIADPSQPILLMSLPDQLESVKVETDGDRVYLLGENGGMFIYDIADPANPRKLGAWYASSGIDMVIEGTLAYVVSMSRLYVVDISDAQWPQQVGEVFTANLSYGMDKSGDQVFVAVENSGVQVFDVSDPRDIISLGVSDTMGYTTDVAVVGNEVFVVHPHEGVHAFDAADPANLSHLWSYDTRGSSEALIAEGDRLVLFELGWGFQLFDISAPPAEVVAREATPGPLYGVDCEGEYCFVAEGELGMQVFDVSNPANPRSAGLFETADSIVGILVKDGIAYLAQERGGTVLVDVSEPSAAVQIGWLNTTNPLDMVLRDDLLFVADNYSGLRIADVSDPANPLQIGWVVTQDDAQGVDVEGDFAYVVHHSGLQVVDISSPGSPITTGSLDFEYDPVDVAVVGSRAYAVTHNTGLVIVDVSQPDAPFLITRVFLPNQAVGIEIEGSVAYIVSEAGGVVMMDISDVAGVRVIGCLPSGESTNDISLGRNHLFIADGSGGLVVAAKQCVSPSPVPGQQDLPGVAGLDGIHPNPFNPRTTISFTLVEAGPVSLRIYDLAGRLVRVLDESVRQGSRHQVDWDGRDDVGRSVASAPYVVRLQADGIEQKQKVLLLR